MPQRGDDAQADETAEDTVVGGHREADLRGAFHPDRAAHEDREYGKHVGERGSEGCRGQGDEAREDQLGFCRAK